MASQLVEETGRSADPSGRPREGQLTLVPSAEMHIGSTIRLLLSVLLVVGALTMATSTAHADPTSSTQAARAGTRSLWGVDRR